LLVHAQALGVAGAGRAANMFPVLESRAPCHAVCNGMTKDTARHSGALRGARNSTLVCQQETGGPDVAVDRLEVS
jgi:hypothetical protein